MATEAIPILISADPAGNDVAPGLSDPSTNLFERIIRSPRPETPYANERKCTEMLASVLLNAPLLRQHLFRWMADVSGFGPDKIDIDALKFEIETERPIGAKRVDLRIDGHANSDLDGPQSLLWIVEVKVGSPFHKGAAQTPDDHGESLDYVEVSDGELVSQLKNYDDWLAAQHAKKRRGFVLALRDLSPELSQLKLKCEWTCLSWTRLGLQVEMAIEDEKLPPQEVMLAKHLLGFIRTNLWSNSEMTETKIDFNDVALIRAFSKIGRDCEERVNTLMEAVRPVIEKSAIGHGKINTIHQLYKWSDNSTLQQFLVPGWTKDADPDMEVCMGHLNDFGDCMGVWLLMSPKHPKWDAVRKAVGPSLKKLIGRNPKWESGSNEAGDWVLLVLAVPLTDLLAAENQQQAWVAFVKAALLGLEGHWCD